MKKNKSGFIFLFIASFYPFLFLPLSPVWAQSLELRIDSDFLETMVQHKPVSQSSGTDGSLTVVSNDNGIPFPLRVVQRDEEGRRMANEGNVFKTGSAQSKTYENSWICLVALAVLGGVIANMMDSSSGGGASGGGATTGSATFSGTAP